MSKTYLIIGASRGLGLEFVAQLASTSGVTVLATYRSGGDTQELNDLAAAHSDAVKLFELDFSSQQSLDALVPKLPKIDRLVVNAGRNGLRDPLLFFEDTAAMAADLEESFRVNTVGPFLTTKALLPLINKGGKIMYLSSSFASMTEAVHDGSPAYSVSKAALNMLVRKFAVELKDHDITVVAMSPGWVKTRMGLDIAPLEPPQSISGMLKQFEVAESGSFASWDGKKKEW